MPPVISGFAVISLRDRAEARRKSRLRVLDYLLEDLEQLNLDDVSVVPAWLAARLEDEGIATPSAHTPSQLIELVWEKQEPYCKPLKGQPSRCSAKNSADVRLEQSAS
jgi:hypothetical protein